MRIVRVHEYECGYGLFAGVGAGAGADVVVDGLGETGDGAVACMVGKSVLMLGLLRMVVLMRVVVCQATPQSLRGELHLPSLSSLPWLLWDCHCLIQHQH